MANLQHKRSKETINSLYAWIDKLHLKQPTIGFFVSKYGNEELNKDVENILNWVNKKNTSHLALHKKEWIRARSNYVKASKAKGKQTLKNWVNPV